MDSSEIETPRDHVHRPWSDSSTANSVCELVCKSSLTRRAHCSPNSHCRRCHSVLFGFPVLCGNWNRVKYSRVRQRRHFQRVSRQAAHGTAERAKAAERPHCCALGEVSRCGVRRTQVVSERQEFAPP